MYANGNSYGFIPPDEFRKPAGLGVLFRVFTGGPASVMRVRS